MVDFHMPSHNCTCVITFYIATWLHNDYHYMLAVYTQPILAQGTNRTIKYLFYHKNHPDYWLYSYILYNKLLIFEAETLKLN